jgi:hypothetical protein
MARRIASRYLAKASSHLRLNEDTVQRMGKEFLSYMREIKQVVDFDSAVQFKKKNREIRESLQRLGNQIRDELEGRIRANVGNKDWAEKYLRTMKPLWDLVSELGEIPMTESTKWSTPEEIWSGWEKGHIKWEARVKTKARAAWKYLSELGDWAEKEGFYGGNEPISLPIHSREIVRLEGFQVEVRNFSGSTDDQEVMENLKAALSKYRRLAQGRLPWVLKHQLPLVAYFQTPESTGEGPRSAAATYNGDHIAIGFWALHAHENDQLVKTLAHEMGHHLWAATLSSEGRSFWSTVVRGDYQDLDLQDVLRKAHPGEDLLDFRDRIKKSDPILYLQLETLDQDTDTRQRMKLYTTEDVLAYIQRTGSSVLQVPAHPITGYSAKNPEEAFCEALGMLIAYGPQAVHDKVLSWLQVLVPALKISSTSLRLAAEPLITIPYLEKLMAVSDWGSAAELLRKLIRNLKNEGSGVTPFPVSELWEYLKDWGADDEDITRLQSVPKPRAKSKVAPDFFGAYTKFSADVGKSVAFTNINPDQDGHLVPELVAWGRAILSLKGAAKALWKQHIQKVILRKGSQGAEDASYNTGGRVILVLRGRVSSIPVLRQNIVHELGHTLQDRLNLSLPIGGLYGSPPFISDYAEKNPDEDFAETFAAFVESPQHLRRTTPEKYRDMAARV